MRGMSNIEMEMECVVEWKACEKRKKKKGKVCSGCVEK